VGGAARGSTARPHLNEQRVVITLGQPILLLQRSQGHVCRTSDASSLHEPSLLVFLLALEARPLVSLA
jgi:hypothetical protein